LSGNRRPCPENPLSAENVVIGFPALACIRTRCGLRRVSRTGDEVGIERSRKDELIYPQDASLGERSCEGGSESLGQ
jgi:hypothetical protein